MSQEKGTALEDEAGLIEGLRRGDEHAYEVLVRSHGPRMLAVARRFVGEAEANDAVQEAFVSAVRAIGGFDQRARIATWLHRIVVNACLQRLRRRKARREVSLEELLPSFGEGGHREDPGSPWAIGAEELLVRRDLRDRMRSAIDQLPGLYRSVLLLRDVEGFTGTEAAELLNVTPNTVKVRLHRARRALREMLDHEVRGLG